MENEELIVEETNEELELEQQNEESVPHTEEFYAKVGNKIFKTKEEYTKHYQKNIKNIKKEEDNKDDLIKELNIKIKKLSLNELNDFNDEYKDFILSKLDFDLEEKELKEKIKLLKKEYPKFLKEIKGNWSNKDKKLEINEEKKDYDIKDGVVLI